MTEQWKLEGTVDGGYITSEDSSDIICLFNPGETATKNRRARLILRAPEMLSLLRDCTNVLLIETPFYVGNGPHTRSLQEKLKALIAEVEGEQ